MVGGLVREGHAQTSTRSGWGRRSASPSGPCSAGGARAGGPSSSRARSGASERRRGLRCGRPARWQRAITQTSATQTVRARGGEGAPRPERPVLGCAARSGPDQLDSGAVLGVRIVAEVCNVVGGLARRGPFTQSSTRSGWRGRAAGRWSAGPDPPGPGPSAPGSSSRSAAGGLVCAGRLRGSRRARGGGALPGPARRGLGWAPPALTAGPIRGARSWSPAYAGQRCSAGSGLARGPLEGVQRLPVEPRGCRACARRRSARGPGARRPAGCPSDAR